MSERKGTRNESSGRINYSFSFFRTMNWFTAIDDDTNWTKVLLIQSLPFEVDSITSGTDSRGRKKVKWIVKLFPESSWIVLFWKFFLWRRSSVFASEVLSLFRGREQINRKEWTVLLRFLRVEKIDISPCINICITHIISILKCLMEVLIKVLMKVLILIQRWRRKENRIIRRK